MALFEKAVRMRGVKALAAAAALAVMGMASQASATINFNITNVSMQTAYHANIVGFGEAYSNGVTFDVSNYPGETQLFGFCIDIYHDMYLYQSYQYQSNQDTGGGLVPNAGTSLDDTQKAAITDLVDTGWLMHQATPNDGTTIMKLAAIQAAIWAIEVPTTNNLPTVTLVNGGLASDPNSYQHWFEAYRDGQYDRLNDGNDRVFTITDRILDINGNAVHQSFAVGWPIPGVPEPSTWGLMILGFGGMGALLRRQRRQGLAAA